MDKAIKNKSAERIVIGILLNHIDWIVEIKGLKYKHFFDKTHKTIFYLIKKLLSEGAHTIDSLSILSRAERVTDATKILEASGGYEYLESIKDLSVNYTKKDLLKHTEEVLTCAYKREQQSQKEHFIRLLHEKPNMSIKDINLWIQEKQYNLQLSYSTSGELKTLDDSFEDVWNEIVTMRGKDGAVGLPSKIEIVNRFFTYRGGELVVIGARAKFGKSNWAINEIHNLAVIKNIPVAYLDTEMKTRTFLARLISIDSGVPIREIENGSYENDPEKKERVEISKERVRKAPIIHKYSYYWDKASVRETALLLHARYGIQMLIYDYIKIKEVGGGIKEHSELGNWTIFLKDLAGEMDIPILTFGQLSPVETRLADSDKINRYASTIAYLLPKDEKSINRDGGIHEGGDTILFVDYNRNGASMNRQEPSKGINLLYERSIVTFEEAPYQILFDEYV